MAHSDVLIFLNSVTWILFLFLLLYFFFVFFFLPSFFKKSSIHFFFKKFILMDFALLVNEYLLLPFVYIYSFTFFISSLVFYVRCFVFDCFTYSINLGSLYICIPFLFNFFDDHLFKLFNLKFIFKNVPVIEVFGFGFFYFNDKFFFEVLKSYFLSVSLVGTCLCKLGSKYVFKCISKNLNILLLK